MKKVLLAIMMIGLFYGSAFAAYDNTAVCTPYSVDNQEVKYSCAFVDSVAGSATEEFRINADAAAGHITEVYWESASEDCDVWIAESVDALVTDADTIISFDQANLGYSPQIPTPRSYFNTSSEMYLYVTVKNDGAIATGTSAILKITYRRY